VDNAIRGGNLCLLLEPLFASLDFRGNFGGEESERDAQFVVRLSFWCRQPAFLTLVSHQNTSPARFFHQASQVQHMGNVRMAKHG